MRFFVSVVVSFTLFVSAAIAQSGTQKQPANVPWLDDFLAAAEQQEALRLPTALYECDQTQCENPHSGGALWLLDGKEGQGMWLYDAVAKLTVVAFDGKTIHIHRADPVGSYSSHFVGGAEWYADYFGTISGNHVEGQVYYFGNRNPDKWRATIVNDDFCDDGKCPLRPDQLSVLGRRAAEAKMYEAAYQCFRLSALQHDADGEGFVGTMIMNGFGIKLPPEQILALLHDSADRDSYAGEKGLAQAYEAGVIVPKDPKQAAWWNERAASWQARKEAAQRAAYQGRVITSADLFRLLLGAMANGSDSDGALMDERAEKAREQDMKVFQREWQQWHP